MTRDSHDGTASGDVMGLGADNDTFFSLGGNDTIYGGAGNDGGLAGAGAVVHGLPRGTGARRLRGEEGRGSDS